jgi:hypothetical protein
MSMSRYYLFRAQFPYVTNLKEEITYRSSVRGGSSRKGHSAEPSQAPCCTWCSSPWNLEEQRQKATMKHQSPSS